MFGQTSKVRQKYCGAATVLRVSQRFVAGSFETLALSEWLAPRTGLSRGHSTRDALVLNTLGMRLSDLETFVVCQNIERYSRLMAEATSTDKRLTLEKLLAEERAKLRTRCLVVLSGAGN